MCKENITFHANPQRVDFRYSLDTQWIITNGPEYTKLSISTVSIFNDCYESIGNGNINRQNLVSQRSVAVWFGVTDMMSIKWINGMRGISSHRHLMMTFWRHLSTSGHPSWGLESHRGRRSGIPHQSSDSPTQENLTSRHVGPRIWCPRTQS